MSALLLSQRRHWSPAARNFKKQLGIVATCCVARSSAVALGCVNVLWHYRGIQKLVATQQGVIEQAHNSIDNTTFKKKWEWILGAKEKANVLTKN